MSKKMIKVHVDTGFVNATHEDHWELPEEWDEWSENAKEAYLYECANDYQEQCVGSYAEVVDEDEM